MDATYLKFNLEIPYPSPPLFFPSSFLIYLLKKLGHLSCRVSYSLNFADCIPLICRLACSSHPYIFCNLLAVRPGDSVRFRFECLGKNSWEVAQWSPIAKHRMDVYSSSSLYLGLSLQPLMIIAYIHHFLSGRIISSLFNNENTLIKRNFLLLTI